MSSRHDNDPDAADETDAEYAAVELDDGGVVIYDSTNYRAWIQSDVAVDLDTRA